MALLLEEFKSPVCWVSPPDVPPDVVSLVSSSTSLPDAYSSSSSSSSFSLVILTRNSISPFSLLNSPQPRLFLSNKSENPLIALGNLAAWCSEFTEISLTTLSNNVELFKKCVAIFSEFLLVEQSLVALFDMILEQK